MGFYGNITNTARTQFQFDRVYPSRWEMERNTFLDGVYAGRYVLIEYDNELSLDNFLRVQFVDGVAYYNPAGETGYRQKVTYAVVKPGEMVYTSPVNKTPAEGLYYTDCVFYTCLDDGKNNLTTAPAVFKQSEITDPNVSNYTRNYNVDTRFYGSGRGYDSTVWQKVYSDQEEKYVMIAELNTVVPTFDVSADAPTLAPIVPHFDTRSTDVYYKLHWQPAWGFRIAASKGNSDENTVWVKESYDRDTDKNIKYYYDVDTSDWKVWTSDKDVKPVPADIFYNAAGFDITTSNHIALEDEVIVRPTGKSGNKYNRHDGNEGEVEKEDIQELSVILPSIGNTIASVWDQLYGTGRFRDVGWKDSVAIENDAEYGNAQDIEIGGMTRDLSTVAGCINSVHDLMGMIITAKSDEYLNEEWYNKDYLYKENDSYYRILEYPTYTLVDYETVLPKRDRYDTDQEYLAAYEETVNDLFALDTDYFILRGNDNNRSAERLNKRAVSALPSGTEVGYITGVDYEFVEVPGLARDLGTIHGMILQMQKMLEQQDADTRDLTTVSGTINTLNDIINLFDSLVPGEILICDTDGKVNSANWTTAQDYFYVNHGMREPSEATKTFNTNENRWISLSLNETTRVFDLKHVFNPISDTTTNSDKNIGGTAGGINNTTDDVLKLYTPIVDDMGHVVGKNTETVVLPYAYKTFKTVGNVTNDATDLDTTPDKVSDDGTTVTPGTPVQTSSTTADNTQDILTINPHNKWLQVKITDDVITMAHEVHGIQTNPLTSDLNDGTDTITFQDIEFDAAGHVTKNQKHTYTLPFGFKTITPATQSSAVTNPEVNTGTIIADNTQDALTMASTNKWIRMSASDTNDTFYIGHEVHSFESGTSNTKYGLEADLPISTLDEQDNTFEVPVFKFDEAGHITMAETHTVTIPENFKSIAVTTSDANSADKTTGTAGTLTADTLEDNLTLAEGNRWINIDADADNDKLTFSHYVEKIESETASSDLNTKAEKTIPVHELVWDAAGHIIKNTTHTYTIPDSIKTIAIKNSGNGGVAVNAVVKDADLIAETMVDTATFDTGNRWIQLVGDADNDKVTIYHAAPGGQTFTTKTDSETPKFGEPFYIPEVKYDEAGHISAVATHTVTMPIPELNAFNANNTNVITGLSMDGTTGKITQINAGLSSLNLSGYTAVAHENRVESEDVTNGDSINTAFSKLQSQMYVEEVARAKETADRQTAISNEATARQDADNALGGRIDTEKSERTSADDALGGRIDTEKSERTSADTALGKRIDDEEVARAAIGTALGEFKTLVGQTYLPKTDYVNPANATFTYKGEAKTLQEIISSIDERLAALEAHCFPEIDDEGGFESQDPIT